MDINENLEKINTIIAYRRFSVLQRLSILKIAKVSNNMNDFLDNLEWELD